MAGRGLYRRWGITPRPEELMKFNVSNYSTYEMKNQVFLFFEIQTIMIILMFCELQECRAIHWSEQIVWIITIKEGFHEEETEKSASDRVWPDSLYAVIYHITAGILFWNRSLDQQ